MIALVSWFLSITDEQVATTLEGIAGSEHQAISLSLVSVSENSALLLLFVEGRVCQLEQKTAGVSADKLNEDEGFKCK